MTRSLHRRPAGVAVLALAAGLVLAPVAASAAYAGGPASASVAVLSTDAAAGPALHVGVRQAAVGDPIPVTIVGAAAGGVWEIVLVSPETLVGTVTIGEDGTGTTMVALPLGTDAGSVAFTASDGDAQISSSLSSAGETSAESGEPQAPPSATDGTTASPLVTPVTVGIAVAALAAVTGVIAFFTLRRRRRASA